MRNTTRGAVPVWNAAADPFDIITDLSGAFDKVTNLAAFYRQGLLQDRGAASANVGTLFTVIGEVSPNTARNGFVYYSDGTQWITVRTAVPVVYGVTSTGVLTDDVGSRYVFVTAPAATTTSYIVTRDSGTQLRIPVTVRYCTSAGLLYVDSALAVGTSVYITELRG